jgi:hypothetical protein
MLGLIQYMTSSFSDLDSLLVLYLVRLRQYASLVWNTITITDSLNLKEFEGNLQLYVTQDFLMAYVTINMKEF